MARSCGQSAALSMVMARLGRAQNCTTFGTVGMHRQPSSGGRSFRTSTSYSRDKCPYEVLNLPQKASKEQIKQTYYLLAKKLHPDVACPVNAPDAKDRFAEINQAYEVLKDHTQRWLYDSGQINSNGAARIHLYCKYTQDFKDALTHPRDHEISQCLSILAWLRVICTRQAEHLQTRGDKREVVPEDAVMEMVWRQVMWEQTYGSSLSHGVFFIHPSKRFDGDILVQIKIQRL